MGLFLTKTIRDASIGIWEINESVEELYASVKLSDQEKEYFSCLKSETRKQHWLSYRLILPYLIQEQEMSAIEYDEFGKPYLNNGVRHISVAHSGKFSALIASQTRNVGIDIEMLHPKILKLSHKFLNKKELRMVFSKNAVSGLCLIWGAKEALFKLYGKRDLQFRENFCIYPFKFRNEGSIYGEICSPSFQKVYKIDYLTIGKYILTYAVDNYTESEA